MSAQLLEQPSIRDSKIVGTAADQLLIHLEDEQTSLAGLLSAVRDVNQSLIALDDVALRKSLEAEVRELSSNSVIQQRRHELRNSLADLFHINPQEVTLRQLVAMTTGSMRQSVERIWSSLLEMAREMEMLNLQNAAMIGQSLAIARGVVEQLTGVTAVNESYNSIGARAQAEVGPLIQWGG